MGRSAGEGIRWTGSSTTQRFGGGSTAVGHGIGRESVEILAESLGGRDGVNGG